MKLKINWIPKKKALATATLTLYSFRIYHKPYTDTCEIEFVYDVYDPYFKAMRTRSLQLHHFWEMIQQAREEGNLFRQGNDIAIVAYKYDRTEIFSGMFYINDCLWPKLIQAAGYAHAAYVERRTSALLDEAEEEKEQQAYDIYATEAAIEAVVSCID